MNSRSIEQTLTENRLQIFAIAIIWIFFRHTFFYNNFSFFFFDYLLQIGDCGVDIFLFLSGYGLFHSYNKNNDIKVYYKKRFKRIIPTYIFFLFLTISVDALMFNLPLSDITPLYLFNLTVCNYWFIGAIIIYYTIFPYICKIVNRINMWYIISIVYLISLFGAKYAHYPNFNIIFARLPIFVLGIIFAYNKNLFSKKILLTILAVAACISFIFVPKGLQRVLYSFLTLGIIIWLPYILRIFPNVIKNFFNVIGKYTLEIYLLHVWLFVHNILDYTLRYLQYEILTVFCVFFITLLFSIIFSRFEKSLLNITKHVLPI